MATSKPLGCRSLINAPFSRFTNNANCLSAFFACHKENYHGKADEALTSGNIGRYRKDYSVSELVFGNLAIILWIGLGAFACSFFSWLAALVFFALVTFLIFYEIGKHGCVTCYYCKTCTIGMGKLPELFFRKAGTANVNRRALQLFPLTFLLLSALPMTLVVISLFQEIVVYKVVLLAAILVFSVHTGITRRQTLLRPSAKTLPT